MYFFNTYVSHVSQAFSRPDYKYGGECKARSRKVSRPRSTWIFLQAMQPCRPTKQPLLTQCSRRRARSLHLGRHFHARKNANLHYRLKALLARRPPPAACSAHGHTRAQFYHATARYTLDKNILQTQKFCVRFFVRALCCERNNVLGLSRKFGFAHPLSPYPSLSNLPANTKK